MCCQTRCKHCGKFPAQHNDHQCAQKKYEAYGKKDDVCPNLSEKDFPKAAPPQKQREEDLVCV